MKQKQDSAINGVALVADYQNVLISMATMQTAKQEADISEQSTMQYLSSVDAGVLNPQDIPLGVQSGLAKASLDAHIKKAQASQLEAMGTSQIEQILKQDKLNYQNKKVLVKILQSDQKPVESLWFDPNKGYKKGVVSTKSIKGKIEEVMLDKNALLIRPTFFSKLFNPARHYFIIYIVNPETLEPMVSLDLS